MHHQKCPRNEASHRRRPLLQARWVRRARWATVLPDEEPDSRLPQRRTDFGRRLQQIEDLNAATCDQNEPQLAGSKSRISNQSPRSIKERIGLSAYKTSNSQNRHDRRLAKDGPPTGHRQLQHRETTRKDLQPIHSDHTQVRSTWKATRFCIPWPRLAFHTVYGSG